MEVLPRLNKRAMDHGVREDTFLVGREGVCSQGRGRGSNLGVGADSVSWNPTWLGSGVSPPSFGPGAAVRQSPLVVGRGRGGANLLASLVSEACPSRVSETVKLKHTDDQYADNSDCSDAEGDEMKLLQQHHREWKREMQFMAERGRQLEDAMQSLLSKRSREKQKCPSDFSVVGACAAATAAPSPLMSSTKAFGVPTVPVEQFVNAAAVFGGSSVFSGQVEDNSMWLRPRNVSVGMTGGLDVDSRPLQDRGWLHSQKVDTAQAVPHVLGHGGHALQKSAASVGSCRQCNHASVPDSDIGVACGDAGDRALNGQGNVVSSGCQQNSHGSCHTRDGVGDLGSVRDGDGHVLKRSGGYVGGHAVSNCPDHVAPLHDLSLSQNADLPVSPSMT